LRCPRIEDAPTPEHAIEFGKDCPLVGAKIDHTIADDHVGPAGSYWQLLRKSLPELDIGHLEFCGGRPSDLTVTALAQTIPNASSSTIRETEVPDDLYDFASGARLPGRRLASSSFLGSYAQPSRIAESGTKRPQWRYAQCTRSQAEFHVAPVSIGAKQ
jgi:hypothetical protein